MSCDKDQALAFSAPLTRHNRLQEINTSGSTLLTDINPSSSTTTYYSSSAKWILRLSQSSLVSSVFIKTSAYVMSLPKSQSEAEKEVRSWGFKHVFTWADGPNAYYAPHSHSGLTTHLILDGELTITYPQDETPKKEKFGPGARIDVDAGRKHEVWMGPQGCTYVIGE